MTNWMPLNLSPNLYIQIPISINGQDGLAILDTGANYSVISKNFKKKAEVRTTKNLLVRGADGAKYHRIAESLTIEVFGVLQKRIIIVAELDHLENVDAILGTDFIEKMAIEIDYPNRKFRFHNLGGLDYLGSNICSPLEVVNGRFFTSLIIDEKKYKFLLDTGSNSDLGIVDEELFKNYRPADWSSNLIIAKGFHGNDVSLYPFTLNQVNIGHLEVKDVPAFYINSTSPFPFGKFGVNSIGQKFLLDYKIIIDPFHRCVYFEEKIN
ncbi:MAG: pepsin/retropepsin-like aspartic protease family protein [Oligoflexus sp.]